MVLFSQVNFFAKLSTSAPHKNLQDSTKKIIRLKILAQHSTEGNSTPINQWWDARQSRSRCYANIVGGYA